MAYKTQEDIALEAERGEVLQLAARLLHVARAFHFELEHAGIFETCTKTGCDYTKEILSLHYKVFATD